MAERPPEPTTYDASAAGSAKPAYVDSLKRLQARDADQRMDAFLDDLDEWTTQARERDRETGLDPGVAVLLEAITGAEDAPLDFASLHRRVADRTLTWEQLWDAPEEEPGGARLVNLAMKLAGAQLEATLAPQEDEEPPAR